MTPGSGICCQTCYRLLYSVRYTRGVEKGVQKYSKSGAKVSDIVEDFTFYNMKSFQSLIVSVEANDASSQTDIELFEEKYDQQICLVKTENPDYELNMCNITPRGDADVRNYNACIAQLATYCKNTKSHLLKNQRVSSLAEMVSRHLAIFEMMTYICQILASSDYYTRLIPKYTP